MKKVKYAKHSDYSNQYQLFELVNKAVKCKKFKEAFLYDEILSNVIKINNKFGLKAIKFWILDHRYGALVNLRLYQMVTWRKLFNLNKILKIIVERRMNTEYNKLQKLIFAIRTPMILKYYFLYKLYDYIAIFFGRFLMVAYVVEISPVADIGKNFWGVFRNVAITAHTRIGKNAYIEANVTIAPEVVVMDNVHIHTGAVLTGHIQIGENAIIGANSLVTRSVPANTTVVGVPAKVVFTIKQDKAE